MANKKTDAAFADLFNRAHAAGMAAGTASTPPTMIVTERANPFNGNSAVINQWAVADGPCGFATVRLRPGTSTAARYAVKNLGWTKQYYGGVGRSVPYFNQSMVRKEAYARAFAGVLTDAGLTAYADSRMD
jgi:hypothetical protein